MVNYYSKYFFSFAQKFFNKKNYNLLENQNRLIGKLIEEN